MQPAVNDRFRCQVGPVIISHHNTWPLHADLTIRLQLYLLALENGPYRAEFGATFILAIYTDSRAVFSGPISFINWYPRRSKYFYQANLAGCASCYDIVYVITQRFSP